MLPLDADGYSRQQYPEFTRDDDVVQIIGEGVRVLMGNSDRFSELNALRLVVHLVGDVHQPIHVACGYLDTENGGTVIVRDPLTAATKHLPNDRGGNNLILPFGSNLSLHSYWDSRLGGNSIDDANGAEADVVEISPELRQRFINKLRFQLEQDATVDATVESGVSDASALDLWAVTWASEALLAA